MKLFLRRLLYGRRYSKPDDLLFNNRRDGRVNDPEQQQIDDTELLDNVIQQRLAEYKESHNKWLETMQINREKNKRLDRLLNYRDPVTCFGKDLFIVWVGSKYSSRGIGDKTNDFLHRHVDDVLALVDSDSPLPREKHYPHPSAGARYTIEYRGGAEVIEGVKNNV